MKIKSDGNKKIIAVDGGKIIGYLKWNHPQDYNPKRNVEIEWIEVNPRYRRQGIARKLIKFFLKKFRNIVWVSLWTGREMEINKSYSLYKKLGFKEIAYQEDYYLDGVGTRLFVKRIKK